MKPLKIGLTGAMGAGKSAASKLFVEFGAVVLFADTLSHHIMQTDDSVKHKIKETFGDIVYLKNDILDKSALSKIVFSDYEKLKILEGIIHPKVTEFLGIFCANPNSFRNLLPANIALFPDDCGQEPFAVLVEIPLLYEKSLDKHFDICITVYCSQALRIKRLQSRSMSAEQIASRDAHQFSAQKKAALSDLVLFNETSLDFLREQIGVFVKTNARRTRKLRD